MPSCTIGLSKEEANYGKQYFFLADHFHVWLKANPHENNAENFIHHQNDISLCIILKA